MRYRLFNGYRILSGCTYCEGALFIYRSPGGDEEVIKCFHCGRMFRHENCYLILSPFREYAHRKGSYLLPAGRGVRFQ